MSKTILVTGGAGYIGSHTVVELLKNEDYEVIILDNFCNSKKGIIGRISEISKRDFTVFDNNCCDDLEHIFSNSKIDGVIHFAALKSVGESVSSPLEYYDNNINSLLNILKYCKKYNVKNIVFSSSCSLYGDVENLPVNEKTPISDPQSPYAYTKLVGERIIKDFCRVNDINGVSLRYFNPVGAHESGLIGECSLSEPNNIVPVICNSIDGDELIVFGDDYQTRDGSCIRDYIHVLDISNAHLLALKWLMDDDTKRKYDVFNLGSESGVTVLELINAFESVNNVKVKYKIGNRRVGDVVQIYSNSTKAKQVLGWETKYNIEDMVSSAWKWYKNKI